MLVRQYKLWDLIKLTSWEFINQKILQKNKWKYKVYNWWFKSSSTYNQYNYEWNQVIMSTRWANAWFTNYITEKFWCWSSCVVCNINNENILNWKYLYYLLKSKESFFFKEQNKSSIPSISRSDILNLDISLPNLETQNKIVNILDTFDNYINWLTNNKTWLSNLIKLNNKLLKFYLETLIK